VEGDPPVEPHSVGVVMVEDVDLRGGQGERILEDTEHDLEVPLVV
jgi:hypothetical protein